MDLVNVPPPQGRFGLISGVWNLAKILTARCRWGKDHIVQMNKGKNEETKELTTAGPGGAEHHTHKEKKRRGTKWIHKRATNLFLRLLSEWRRRNKRRRKMRRTRVFSSLHFSALVNHTPKSLRVSLPLGPWKHLTLLTSLPERAWVQGRQRDSTMRENWREKDESSRKRGTFSCEGKRWRLERMRAWL